MGGAREANQNCTYQFDFVRVLGLGLISALGGEIARDVLFQHEPPLAFTDIRYLLIALADGIQHENLASYDPLILVCGGSWLFRGRWLNTRSDCRFFQSCQRC